MYRSKSDEAETAMVECTKIYAKLRARGVGWHQREIEEEEREEEF